MEYEQDVFDLVAKRSWHSLFGPADYEEKVEDGMVMIAYNGCWYPVSEAVQDQFPFYDISDEELQEMFGVYHEKDDPLDYWTEYDEEVYDMKLLE